uniref:Secreted protein n=1 Tax=Arundo donax TaxID=35708 RepID=A0A0A8YIE1_ARUDO
MWRGWQGSPRPCGLCLWVMLSHVAHGVRPITSVPPFASNASCTIMDLLQNMLLWKPAVAKLKSRAEARVVVTQAADKTPHDEVVGGACNILAHS